MASLYVTETGARIEIEYQRVLVTKNDEILIRVPLQHVSQIVLIGRVGITTPAIHRLINNNIPVMFLDYGGRYLGRIQTATSYNLPLRQMQYTRNDVTDFCSQFAKSIVAGKIRNQRTYLKRLSRRSGILDKQTIDQIGTSLIKIKQAKDHAELLGIEGYTSRVYFSLFHKMFSETWAFNKRTRRPPKDPINALLSLGYTLLTSSMISALEIVGLDPYLGFFHIETYGRPALALDLIEEFRTPIVDSLVLDIISHNRIDPEDFQYNSNGHHTLLNRRGFRIFLKEYSNKMESEIKTRELGRPLSYQKHLEVQARRFIHSLESDENSYQPFKIR